MKTCSAVAIALNLCNLAVNFWVICHFEYFGLDCKKKKKLVKKDQITKNPKQLSGDFVFNSIKRNNSDRLS